MGAAKFESRNHLLRKKTKGSSANLKKSPFSCNVHLVSVDIGEGMRGMVGRVLWPCDNRATLKTFDALQFPDLTVANLTSQMLSRKKDYATQFTVFIAGVCPGEAKKVSSCVLLLLVSQRKEDCIPYTKNNNR